MSSRLNQKTPKQKTRLRSGAAMIELALFLTVFFIITMGTIETSIVDPTLIATLAASQNIEIHTITFSAEADQTRMQEIAQACGGKHYHTTSGSELTKAFDAISRTLPTLITH